MLFIGTEEETADAREAVAFGEVKSVGAEETIVGK
jgi:hypothetical protein